MNEIIICTLTSIGICATTWQGMIFEKAADWIESKVGEWWAKPLGKCYICTTFWVSLAMCAILDWPLWYALPAMGLSAVISLFQYD
jgi:hypothetical protein